DIDADGDLDKSLDFYTRLLNMKLLRKKDFPGGKFTLALVGYGDEAKYAKVLIGERIALNFLQRLSGMSYPAFIVIGFMQGYRGVNLAGGPIRMWVEDDNILAIEEAKMEQTTRTRPPASDDTACRWCSKKNVHGPHTWQYDGGSPDFDCPGVEKGSPQTIREHAERITNHVLSSAAYGASRDVTAQRVQEHLKRHFHLTSDERKTPFCADGAVAHQGILKPLWAGPGLGSILQDSANRARRIIQLRADRTYRIVKDTSRPPNFQPADEVIFFFADMKDQMYRCRRPFAIGKIMPLGYFQHFDRNVFDPLKINWRLIVIFAARHSLGFSHYGGLQIDSHILVAILLVGASERPR
ncbi:hypothetical protein LCGC14_3001310, partial [marine sediment metagenome]